MTVPVGSCPIGTVDTLTPSASKAEPSMEVTRTVVACEGTNGSKKSAILLIGVKRQSSSLRVGTGKDDTSKLRGSRSALDGMAAGKA